MIFVYLNKYLYDGCKKLLMHQIHLKIQYLLRKEINELYITNAIRAFAISTVSIFIPLFLLRNDYSIMQVSAFVLLELLIGVIACYYGLKLASSKGVKHVMVYSIPLMILNFLMLYNISGMRFAFGEFGALFFIALSQALGGAFYYMGFHLEFAKFSNRVKSVKQVGITNILMTIGAAIGPLIGSEIITRFSFNVLFLIVIGLLSLSMIPLFMTKEHHIPFVFNFKIDSKEFREAMVYFGEGVRDMSTRIIWPILFYILFSTFTSIGAVYAFANTILIVTTYYLGKKIHHSNKLKILKFGTYLHAVSLIIRTIVKTLASLTAVMGFGAFTWTLVALPFMSIFYNNTKKKGLGTHIFFRELFLGAGRAFEVIILIILLGFFSIKTSLIIAIIISSAFLLLMGLIREE